MVKELVTDVALPVPVGTMLAVYQLVEEYEPLKPVGLDRWFG